MSSPARAQPAWPARSLCHALHPADANQADKANPLPHAIDIAAPRERDWSCPPCRDWTAVACEGSYREGEWRTGADIRFLGPGGAGMRARIERADHPADVGIQHPGELRDGVPGNDRDWVGAYERYRFLELADGGTRLEIELSEVPDQYVEMMNTMWPQALERLRQICLR